MAVGKRSAGLFLGHVEAIVFGTSSPSSRGRAGEVEIFVTGLQSKPTLLRTPCATYSKPVPSGLTREMLACVSGGMQMLQGAPMLK